MSETTLVREDRPGELTTSAMLMAAAQSPDVDAAKIRALWEIKKEIDETEARTQFYRAMKACQDEIKPIVRKSKNTQTGSMYAKLEAIDALIKPIYHKHGFGIMWTSPMIEGNKVNVACKVIHTAGHAEPFTLPGPLDISGIKGQPNKTEMWALGSSLSYLKRYLKCFIFDLALTNEDNDGQGANALTEEQKMQVLDLLADCAIKPGSPAMTKFLEFAEADSVAHIQQHKFSAVISALRQKAAKKE